MEDWYGWIPNLAWELFPNELLFFLEKEEITEEEFKQLEIIKKEDRRYYTWLKKITDEEGEPQDRVVVSLNNEGFTEEVIILDNNWDIKSKTDCEVEKTGLIRIFDIYGSNKEGIAKQTYIIVRDLYHFHTHHEHEDLLLPPVKSDDKEEAVRKIAKEYKRKIPSYHKQLKQLISLEKSIITEETLDESEMVVESTKIINSISELIKKARGEMLYAITFCKLHSDMLEKDYPYPFSRSYESLNTLGEEVDRINSSNFLKILINLSKTTGDLTKILIILTIFIIILTLINISLLL